jgi:nuclear pore complex protein Nup93
MSSLFGGPLNTGASQAGGSSLLGASTTTSRPTQSTLFGTAATQSQPTSTLFGALGSSQAQQQPAAQATTGASNTLFGRIGSSTTQPQQSTTAGSLFGSLGASTAQPQQTTAGGLFGTTTTAANQNTPAPGASTVQAAQSQGPLAQSTAASTSQSAYFDNLLERGKKRNRRENGSAQFGELPSLQLGLGDIARKVQKLSQGGPPLAQQARDSRVYVL